MVGGLTTCNNVGPSAPDSCGYLFASKSLIVESKTA